MAFLDNCIRQEKGYCRIQWQQSSSTSPDPFQLDITIAAATTASGNAGTTTICYQAYVKIPDGSFNGITGMNPGLVTWPFQNLWCGSDLGLQGSAAPATIVCKLYV